MPFPPRGLKAEEHPLKHKFRYAFGLSPAITLANSAFITLVKNYKSVTDPTTTFVNPMSAQIDNETGAICAPMSIVQRLTLSMQFTALQASSTDEMKTVKFSWMPVFGSFADKWDADDTGASGGTVAAMLQLTKDATEEDMTPITTTKLKVVGTSDTLHPLSTVNLVESATTHLNMTTDAAMEECPFNQQAFFNLIQYGTNKGALKACVGRIRHGSVTFGVASNTKSYFLKKFVPRAVRRIMPFSFFGIIINCPLITEHGSSYTEKTSLSTTLNYLGVKIHVNYDEWNSEHNNTMSNA